MNTLMRIAEDMAAGKKRITGEVFDEVRSVLPFPCNDEDIAGLALIVRLAGETAEALHAGDLKSCLTRNAAVRPRWDIVLPRLASRHLVALHDFEGNAIMESEHNRLRDEEVRITLLLPDSVPQTPVGYPGNRQYLEDCFAWIERLYDELCQQYSKKGRTAAASTGARHLTAQSVDVQAMRRHIRRLSGATKSTLPLEELRRDRKLEERDWMLLLHVLRKELLGESVEVREVAPYFGDGVFASYALRQYFEGEGRLLQEQLLCVRAAGSIMHAVPEIERTLLDALIRDEHHDRRQETSQTNTDPPFRDNEEYLATWIGFLDEQLETHSHQHPGHRRVNRATVRLITGRSDYRQLLARTQASSANFPLERLLLEYNIGEEGRIILLAALRAGIAGHATDTSDLVPLLADSLADTVRIRKQFLPEAPLVSNDLITVSDCGFGMPDFTMPEHTMRQMLHIDEEALQPGDIHSDSGLFSVCIPRHTLEELCLPEAETARLDAAVRGMDTGAQERLRKWGAATVTASRAVSSLLLLFSGPPGSGKTFAAEALAGTLGRPLLTTDISRMLSKWVGESEKQVMQLFSDYRRHCTQTASVPVLLLNECDQFLSRRFTGAERAVDRMYNQMQNLFLEQLESFPGILIATTNLTEALDPAFSRRFDENIIFPLPDSALRLRLWQAHIPPDVPRLDNLRLEEIAARFAFSGGNIAVVAANALRIAAVRGDGLRAADLLQACEHETAGDFETGSRPIGFRQLRTTAFSELHTSR
ncbi:MAG: ATP-binding protein [Bacteroidetes bacterium]|nr:ATP-binding protein [Bacteroidota bacterium]